MRRAEGWEIRLRELIEARRFMPFRFGTNDCASMAADDYRAMMGIDPPNFPRWSTATDADMLLKDNDLEGLTTNSIGKPIDGYKLARRGDIVLIKSNMPGLSERALAVCVGPLLAAPGPTAITFVPLGQGLKTWRIGD